MSNVYVAGLDGGGTKTTVVVLGADGSPVGRQAFGPLNPNGNTEETVRQTLSEVLAYLRSLNGSVRQLVLGAAGVSNPQCVALWTSALHQNGYQGGVAFAGDDETALRGAVGMHGIILIAGTGSICFGRSADNQEARCGGCGYLIDDGGSGYAIGRDIFAAAARQLDGRISPTLLTKAVMELFGLHDRQDLVKYVYDAQTGKKGIAAATPLLFAAVGQNDLVAISIAKRAAAELSLLAETVIRRLHAPQSEIALLGGVLTQGAFIREEVKRLLKRRYPELCFIEPKHDAAYGAAEMAREIFSQGGNENG